MMYLIGLEFIQEFSRRSLVLFYICTYIQISESTSGTQYEQNIYVNKFNVNHLTSTLAQHYMNKT